MGFSNHAKTVFAVPSSTIGGIPTVPAFPQSEQEKD